VKLSEAKRAIMRDLRGWRGVLDLDGWTIHSKFRHLDAETVASCDASWPYKEATISFDLEALAGCEREDIRKSVLHELVHLVCSGYQRIHTTEQLEYMTTTLTLALLRCWEAPAPKERR